MFRVAAALVVCLVCVVAELKVETIHKPVGCGEGKVSAQGDRLYMHYTGKIDESSATGTKGKVFDSSLTRGQPFDFLLGGGQVILGWETGLIGMCEGEKRVLIIPPEMGYGDRGAGADIPGGATLNFEVECLSIGGAQPAAPQPNIFEEIDKNKDAELTVEEMTYWFTTVRGMEKVPDGLWEKEDKDGDGIITWAEFEGPKGTEPPQGGDEL